MEGIEKKGRAGEIFEQRNNTGTKGFEQRDQFSPFDEPDSLFDIRFVHPSESNACREKNADMLSPSPFNMHSLSVRYLGREIAEPFNLITTVYP